MVQALHLTPGRRLLPCIEKLQHCMQIHRKTASIHPMVPHLLDLLRDEGDQTSSLQALAAAVGCVQDDDDLMVTRNADHLMQHLVHTLMSCSDYKIRDMGHRQELKFAVTKKSFGCLHRPCDEIVKHKHYPVTLRLKQFEGGKVSDVQNALDNSLKTEWKRICDQCQEENLLSQRRHIKIHCDPDFLTLFFDQPRNLLERDLILQFSESNYAVKVVTQWDKERQKSAVSVQRSDGWWWHGTDMDQASHYKYTEKQTNVCNPCSNAIVLMCVRVVPFDDCDDMAELLDYANSQEEIIDVDIPDTLMEDEGGQNNNEQDFVEEENQDWEHYNLCDDHLLYDYEAAVIESRRTNPNLKTQAEMVEAGIRCMESFGVCCSRPADLTPLDGDCLWTCFVKSRDPSLVGDALRAEVLHQRLKCVGAAIEEIKGMDSERLAMVQSVIAVAKQGVQPQTKEEIIAHLTQYMERGRWDGQMGDLLPYVAASFSNQGLLIVDLNANTISYAAPDCKMFHGREDFKVPCIAVKQTNHFENLSVKHDSRDATTALYELLKNGEHLTLPAEIENSGAFETAQQNKLYHCNCGYNGAIAVHLRSSNQCVQSLREELSIGAEMSDEVLIIQATLLFGGCPAPGCLGGSHEDIPDICLAWWIANGWKLMQWQGTPSQLNSALIQEATKEFVKELSKGFEGQNREECSTPAENVSIFGH